MIMLLAGRYSKRLYVAYSVFYVIGSLSAMTIPFVGFNVINRAECAASHGVFAAIQLYAFASLLHSSLSLKLTMADPEIFISKAKKIVIYAVLIIITLAVASYLINLQLTGGLQWTGRSLTLLDPTYATKFMPIIASVSEHQPTAWTAYFFDLHILVPLSPLGMFCLFYQNMDRDGTIFLLLYGTIAWYFAGVMVRLMLTLAPVACILSGVGASCLLTRFSATIKDNMWWSWVRWFSEEDKNIDSSVTTTVIDPLHPPPADTTIYTLIPPTPKKPSRHYRVSSSVSVMVIIGLYVMFLMYTFHCVFCAIYAYSSPSIVIDGGFNTNGSPILLDDFREAYFWLRHNTATDAKILSWYVILYIPSLGAACLPFYIFAYMYNMWRS